MADPDVFVGYLGWSNVRGGPEFYSVQNDQNGRWVPRRTGGPDADKWGDLLVDEMAEASISEGAEVIVVALPRFHGRDVDLLRDIIRGLVDDEDVAPDR